MVIVTLAGDDGFVNVNGPTTVDVHPFNVTVMFEYVPADKPDNVTVVPLPVEYVPTTAEPQFKLYDTE